MNNSMIQGSQEWLNLRKTKITATDAATILGANPWKTKLQLFHEKLSDDPPMIANERMQRGSDLEPIARDLFIIQSGIHFQPEVIIKEWAMASLDGISPCGKYILEIKCPGAKHHATAVNGKIPNHYYPQLQHQMYVCDVDLVYYFSFDGFDGVKVEVRRDDNYIQYMIEEEKKFYDCMITNTLP